MKNLKPNVCVIGGGAAGFFGALQLAEKIKSKANIVLLEKSKEPLGKVKISGGGRCNVTHNLFDIEELIKKYPRGSKELKYAFQKFQPKDTITWFQKRNVALKAEEDGRMFPTTDSSSTIINCFLSETQKQEINLLLGTGVRSIFLNPDSKEERFVLSIDNDTEIKCACILIATGSSKKVWNWLTSLGHTIEPPVPSLFTFSIPNSRYSNLPGISVPKAEVRLLPKGKPQSGPLLITHWGFSGPAILKLSAFEAKNLAESDYKAKIGINWIGDFQTNELFSYFTNLRKDNPSKLIGSISLHPFPSRLFQMFLSNANIPLDKRLAETSNDELSQLSKEITAGEFDMDGKSTFKDEFVTCGGVKRKEINFEKMESKIIPGMFFAGEVIDIDGITGGFNFQNAWTTSTIASIGIDKYLT
ncbi:MAG: NAD(P)/FAD-dependent oxidoreductase [Leptospiraceae bacterium]|nr:NAD(P)/FAD-dependent oxidoreductase [Leptospiraceae bacterium]MCP5495825.1 NAD(P)/FAD-dependent oxidoreductase [Leptospiraceae bacterium]